MANMGPTKYASTHEAGKNRSETLVFWRESQNETSGSVLLLLGHLKNANIAGGKVLFRFHRSPKLLPSVFRYGKHNILFFEIL